MDLNDNMFYSDGLKENFTPSGINLFNDGLTILDEDIFETDGKKLADKERKVKNKILLRAKNNPKPYKCQNGSNKFIPGH